MNKIIISILISFMSTGVLASDNIRAKVMYVGTWGHGGIFINLDKVMNEPGCSKKEIWIPGTSPSIKEILGLAMTAYAADQFIHVKTKGCVNGYPTINPTNESFFHLGPR
ncbi:hypothetical protein [Enterovibrio norvegicus]|uniref:Uncharacterized protein n=1 Tax=Enterovibrio norvegicus TaxID=188144 RepID=A0ABV4L9T1_9GAMM|nr:hypothetical protein [Enterovibrio norvegicus]OEF58626.1 hypothetical protein A1OU_10725 [Enterovibrio norvegicus]